jgi:hypothetical protein
MCAQLSRIVSWCIVLSLATIAILTYVFDKKRDALIEDMKAQGIIVDVKTLASTRPAGTIFYDGPWEDSLFGFLLSAEAGGDEKNPENAKPEKWPWDLRSLGITLEDVFSTEDLEKADKVRAVVMEQQELIERLKILVNQAPVSPEMLYENNMGNPNLWEIPIPNLLALRNFANLLAMDASVKWRNGDVDSALENCEVIIRLARHVADQPTLISQMIAVALVGIATQSIAAMGPDAYYSDTAIERIDPILTNVFGQDLITKSLKYELLYGLHAFRVIERGKNLSDLAETYSSPWFNACRAHDEMFFLKVMGAGIEQSMRPFYEQGEILEFHKLDWRTPVSAIFLLNFNPAAYQFNQMVSQFSQARIALALMRYRRDSGAYPETLEALVPTYLPKIPEDPFSGKMMPYQVGPEGYLLSSVGKNGQDDVLKTDGKQTQELNGFAVVASDDILWCPAVMIKD